MGRVKLTAEQQRILKSQTFDATTPGALLHDFQVVLDVVTVEGVMASGKHHLLPLTAIPTLDEKLNHPLRLSLERPQLRSHPYLLGLNLLLRASGLSRVDGEGAKTRLCVDATALEAWKQLNPTEQYFTLLEAWFLNGNGEVIGVEEPSWAHPFSEFMRNWNALSTRKQDSRFSQAPFLLGFGRTLHSLALADLFGLLAVEYPRKPAAPWGPLAAEPTPFGLALLAVFGDPFAVHDVIEEIAGEGAPGSLAFGRLHSLFARYFPEWRNNLVLPEPERQDGVFVFKVSLVKVWRLIAIGGKDTLDDLAGCILDSFKFDDDHLYEFSYANRFGATVKAVHPEGADDGELSTDEVHLRDLPLRPGQAMCFLFDFGDDWEFTVKLERVDPPKARMKLPKILERHGKAPEQYSGWDE